MNDLASITLNRASSGDDVGMIVRNIHIWDVRPGGGAIIQFSNGMPPLEVTETVAQVQTAINALWDQYAARGSTTAAYTPTNVTTDRAYDADSTTTAELADVLGTLIADLQSLGLIS